MRAFHTDAFVLPLPAGHRFPMAKYARLRQRVEAELPAVRLEMPPPASDAELARAHSPGYVDRVVRGELGREEQRRIGFPWSPEMVERSRRSAGATIAACRAALAEGVAASLAGGTHHAFADYGSGYCVFNDSAVAARALQAQGRVRRVAIIDCDVHQGDGTAAIFAGDDEVFTVSLHGANNFPFRKQASRLAVALADGAGDEAYLDALDRALGSLFERFAPDLAIYLAGADPYAGDRLGRLALTPAGLAERDRRVFAECAKRALPVAVTMAGGYAEDIDDTVGIHLATLREAARSWAARNRPPVTR